MSIDEEEGRVWCFPYDESEDWGDFKSIEEKVAWMEDMRKSLLEGLEDVIDINFSPAEAVYVRNLDYYRWTHDDIANDQTVMGLALRGHDGFYHVVNGFLEELGLPLVREIKYGLEDEERPSGDRVAQLAQERGMTVHQWLVHVRHELDERNREAEKWYQEHIND